MTTGISLVRENTQSMEPPRALWVTFPLGRPLGIPGDEVFQLNVIRAGLDLLNRDQGPVLEDYPHDVPALEVEVAAACPVSFARDKVTHDTWQSKLTAEFALMRPWYELGLRRRQNRTLVGMSDQAPNQNLQLLAEFLDKGEIPVDIVWLKRAVEDLKTYYREAMTSQPGEYQVSVIQEMFWNETVMGAAILVLFHAFQESEEPHLKVVARMLAPREAIGASTGLAGDITNA